MNYLDELRAHDASAPRLSNAAAWADDWSHGNIWAIAKWKGIFQSMSFWDSEFGKGLVEEKWPKMQMIKFLWCLEFRLNPRDILYAFFVLFGFKYVLIHNDVRSGKPSETLITKCRQKALAL